MVLLIQVPIPGLVNCGKEAGLMQSCPVSLSRIWEAEIPRQHMSRRAVPISTEEQMSQCGDEKPTWVRKEVEDFSFYILSQYVRDKARLEKTEPSKSSGIQRLHVHVDAGVLNQ